MAGANSTLAVKSLVRKQRARGGFEMGAIEGGQLRRVAAAGSAQLRCSGCRAARVVVRARRADWRECDRPCRAPGCVAPIRRSAPAWRAQAVEQHGRCAEQAHRQHHERDQDLEQREAAWRASGTPHQRHAASAAARRARPLRLITMARGGATACRSQIVRVPVLALSASGENRSGERDDARHDSRGQGMGAELGRASRHVDDQRQ